MRFTDRYTAAVPSRNLTSDPDTRASDSDVLGAAGLAAKPRRMGADGVERPGSPLGIALMRLLAGDNHASAETVRILAGKAVGKAYRLGIECRQVEADDLARAVLAWHRHGTCRQCGGHGVRVIPGTTTLGGEQCSPCGGTGRRLLRREIPMQFLALAEWLAVEIERELAFAGPAAMHALAPSLDLPG